MVLNGLSTYYKLPEGKPMVQIREHIYTHPTLYNLQRPSEAEKTISI